MDPNPVADHDPFSLGDSDDEEVKKKEGKVDDSNQLKHSAAGLTADGVGPPDAQESEPGKQTSTGRTNNEVPEKLAEKPTN